MLSIVVTGMAVPFGNLCSRDTIICEEHCACYLSTFTPSSNVHHTESHAQPAMDVTREGETPAPLPDLVVSHTSRDRLRDSEKTPEKGQFAVDRLVSNECAQSGPVTLEEQWRLIGQQLRNASEAFSNRERRKIKHITSSYYCQIASKCFIASFLGILAYRCLRTT